MLGRVIRVRWSCDQRCPIQIRLCGVIAVGIRSANSRYRSPEVVRVLTIEYGNRRVSTRDIQQGKEACIFVETVLSRVSCRNSDVVPVDLAVLGLEKSRFGLIGGAGDTVNCAEAFHLIEICGVFGAR